MTKKPTTVTKLWKRVKEERTKITSAQQGPLHFLLISDSCNPPNVICNLLLCYSSYCFLILCFPQNKGSCWNALENMLVEQWYTYSWHSFIEWWRITIFQKKISIYRLFSYLDLNYIVFCLPARLSLCLSVYFKDLNFLNFHTRICEADI